MAYLGVLQPTPLTAFGEINVAANQPRIQLQFAYNINSDEVTTAVTGSGTVTHSQPFAVLSTTAASSSSATMYSKRNIHYRTGQGGIIFFTAVYTTGVTGSTQIVGAGDSVDGLFFGYNGDTFGINRRYNSGDNWIAQSSWNVDPMDGTGPSGQTLDPTKGNVYKILYQWLGYGMIFFYIENTNTGMFQLVHQIKYANTSANTTLLNPSFPMYAQSANTTNDTDIVIKTPSMAAMVQGPLANIGVINAIGNYAAVSTEAAILTIRNNTTFNSITNKKYVAPTYLSFAPTGNIILIYNLWLNTSLGGTPSYTAINANTSVVSYDVAGTTVSGGKLVGKFFVNGNDNISIDVSANNYQLQPGDTLTITGTSSGVSSTAAAAIMWQEEF